MKLDLSKLTKEINGSKFSKSEIASKCGIDRKTIENVLAGRDPKVSTIISLATILNLKISYLFDEEVDIEMRQAGRDYVEKGKIEHQGMENYGVSCISDIEKENAELKRKLISAQEKIIELISR